jgi:hypothetical protein
MLAAAVLAVGGLSASSDAALLVDFKPDPISPVQPEFRWDGTRLDDALGSTGSADGNDPAISQGPGGLRIETPLTLPTVGIGGSVNVTTGSTTFLDVSLELDGFVASAPASSLFGLVFQPVSEGSFRLLSTAPLGGGERTLLLSGTVANSVISGLTGGSSGSALSGNITYTGGLIFTQALAQGFQAPGGSFSWSLLDIAGDAGQPLGVGGNGNLGVFSANATGLFSAVPEPATMGLLLVGAAAAGFRRRRA